eukprot:COSAG02_NODE_2846_length_7905_cov_14.993378_6_plen_117_part_00
MNETQFRALKVALGGERTSYGQDIRMSSWLQEIYPLPEVQEAMRIAEMHECIQAAGETMFVPPGYHHAVLNIGETVAVAVQKTGPGGAYEGAADTRVNSAIEEHAAESMAHNGTNS